MVRAGVQVRAVVRVVRPLDRTNYSVQRAIPALELPDVKFICIYYITVCYSVSVYLTEHLKML